MAFLSEAAVEEALLDQLRSLGYSIEREDDIGPDGTRPERESHDEVILVGRLEQAVARLNPALPIEARRDAIRQVTQSGLPQPARGKPAAPSVADRRRPMWSISPTNGTLTSGKVTLVDYERPELQRLDGRQPIRRHRRGHPNRRPDVVVFVNGLPLVVIELKARGSDTATLMGAFNQLQTYKQQIRGLFTTNALLITSDGILARSGPLSGRGRALHALAHHRRGWASPEKGTAELSTLVEGVLDHRRLLELLCDFTVFGETGSGLRKIIAGYHQFHAVKRAVESTLRASSVDRVAQEDQSTTAYPAYELRHRETNEPGSSGTPRARERACSWPSTPVS